MSKIELKPCLHCGNEANTIRSFGQIKIWGYRAGCSACSAYVIGQTEIEAIKKWNTRAEKTCKMVPFVEEDGSIFIVNCSECGDAIFARGGEHGCNYCPNCGAKVVE